MQITNMYSAHRTNDKVMGARKIYDQVGYKSRWIFATITYGRHERTAGYFLKVSPSPSRKIRYCMHFRYRPPIIKFKLFRVNKNSVDYIKRYVLR